MGRLTLVPIFLYCFNHQVPLLIHVTNFLPDDLLVLGVIVITEILLFVVGYDLIRHCFTQVFRDFLLESEPPLSVF